MSVRNKTPHPEESFLPAGCFLPVYVFAGTWSFRFLRSITVKMTANVNSNMLMICDVERPNRKPRISSPLKNSSMNLMTGYVKKYTIRRRLGNLFFLYKNNSTQKRTKLHPASISWIGSLLTSLMAG